MRTIVFALSIFLVCFVAHSERAYAHVFVKETSGKTGAILHINPDDDPVVGKESNLFYDIQDPKLKEDNFSAMLVIVNDGGEADEIGVSRGKNSVSANYTFTKTGAYELKLYIEQNGNASVYEYTQRVSRGGEVSGGNEVNRQDAKLAVIGSSVLLGVLIVIVINRREEIDKHSTW